uniref:Aos n=1 Tax=Arundo donax TaxID=35708 RepID=A0A0A9NG16_ARUDO
MERVEERLLQDHGKAERDERVELPDQPLGRLGRTAGAELRR